MILLNSLQGAIPRAEAKRQPEDIRTRMATVMTALPLVTA